MKHNIKCIKGYFEAKDILIANKSVRTVFDMNEEEYIVYSKEIVKYNAIFGCLFDDHIPELYSIGNAGFIVFMYICRHIEFNCNYIKLTQPAVASEVGITSQAVGKGIKSLIDKNIIKKVISKPFTYVINHNIYFKGNIVELINKLKEK